MKSILLTVLLFLSVQFHPSILNAQSDTGHYQKVTYFQVDGEKLHLFEELAGHWKESKEDLIQTGDRLAWRLYHVPFSSNEKHRYNFVSVEIASTLNALESEIKNDPDLMAQPPMIKLFFAVHSEIWKTEADVYGDGTPPSRYLNANFMYAQPDRIRDYLELETDIARPLHQNQTNNNRMDGWNFNRLVFPTGTTVPYNFITTDFYSKLEQIEMGITREIIMNVHPEMDVSEFEDFADSIRERVWSDLWELLKFVE
jgi:hypothetical protein